MTKDWQSTADRSLAAFLAQVRSNGHWLLHHIDLATDSAQLVEVDEAVLHRSRFLDARLQAEGAAQYTVPLSGLIEALGERRAAAHCSTHQLRWIFHSGQGGSTLLTNLLATACPVVPYREPLPLRTISAAWRERAQPHALVDEAQLVDMIAALRLLQLRPVASGDAPLIKATSDVSGLARQLLAQGPDDRAVLLITDLATYLAQAFRDRQRRMEVARFVQSRMVDLQSSETFSDLRLSRLDEIERIALAWFSSSNSLAGLAKTFGHQVLTIESRDLRADPVNTTLMAARHLQLTVKAGDVHGQLAGVLNRNSKRTDQRFDAQAWQAEITAAKQRFGAEIAAGIQFAKRLLPRASYPPFIEQRLQHPAELSAAG